LAALPEDEGPVKPITGSSATRSRRRDRETMRLSNAQGWFMGAPVPMRWWLLLAATCAGCAAIKPGVVPSPVPAAAVAKPIGSNTTSLDGPVRQVSHEVASQAHLGPEVSPFSGAAELSVDALVEQILARNPTVAQMTAAWQAASARYPQVTSLDD